jgi:hypothetical protein
MDCKMHENKDTVMRLTPGVKIPVKTQDMAGLAPGKIANSNPCRSSRVSVLVFSFFQSCY